MQIKIYMKEIMFKLNLVQKHSASLKVLIMGKRDHVRVRSGMLIAHSQAVNEL